MDASDEKKLKEEMLNAVSGGIGWDPLPIGFKVRYAPLASDSEAGKQQIKSLFHEGDVISGTTLTAAHVEKIHTFIDENWEK